MRILGSVKLASHRRTSITGVSLCEVPRVVRPTKRSGVIARGWGRGGDRRCLTARASVGEDGVLCGWTRAGWGGVLQSNVKTLNTNVSTLNWTLKLIKTVKFTCYHKLFFVFF